MPTLRVGDEVWADSREILAHVDAGVGGPRLSPSERKAAALMESWIERAYSISERVLAYSTDRQRSLGLRSNRGRARALKRRMQKFPELADVYGAKLADIEQFMADVDDPRTVQLHHQRLRAGLDDLETTLASHTFIVGDGYSLAASFGLSPWPDSSCSMATRERSVPTSRAGTRT